MATVTQSLDDDFILTLSDEEYAGEANNNDNNSTFGDASVSKKRKRERSETASKNKKQKKQPLHKTLKGKPQIIEGRTTPDDDSDEDVVNDGEDDGALNPDLEFDIGGNSIGVIENFDGWDVRDNQKEARSSRRGVDIDEIIARRQIRIKETTEGGVIKKVTSSERESTEDKHQQQQGSRELEDFPSFEDDELLAPDGFGMGARSESASDKEEQMSDDAPNSEDGSQEEEGGGNHADGKEEGGSDEEDSVASHVPHPDDLASDDDSEAEIVDIEEEEKRKAFFAPEESPADNSSTVTFQNFNLSRPILRGLAAVGFTIPTPIQRKTIPVGLMGKDVVGGAVTGSGKTAAFIIPILERLLYRPRKVPTSRVAILMPTRELAVQCYNVATRLATYTDITFCQLVGGFSLREQENVLKKRPDVIIATPGRFIDHMRNSASFTVDTLEILVLDEADRMLEDGFADELNEILTTIPKSRQTMLFSATMTDSVDKLIGVGLNRPVKLMVDSQMQTVGTLVQEFVRLRPGKEDKRLAYLMCLCTNVYTDRVIIFFRQKREVHRIRVVFGLCGLRAAELHGSMNQDQRIKSVEDFRDGRAAFLLATDVASRGLDIKGVETVINYEAPQTHEIYLHRVGRTARAGRSGRSCTIAAEPDRKVVKAAVKTGKAQGAKIVSRVVNQDLVEEWVQKVEGMVDEIEEILYEEREEKQLAQTEMQVTKGENLIKHHAEIISRPKRTWFESEKEKLEARKRGLVELNGPNPVKKEKGKLSGKEKKKLDAVRERKEGRIWKKGKTERESRPPKNGKSKKGGMKNKKHGKVKK